MEIRVYKNMLDYGSRKVTIVHRIDLNPSVSFPYDSAILTFKSMYGVDCVIEFLIL